MSEQTPNPTVEEDEEPRFSDDADFTGNSGLWMPVLLTILLFLIVAGAFMLFSSLRYDATGPETPGRETQPSTQTDAP